MRLRSWQCRRDGVEFLDQRTVPRIGQRGLEWSHVSSVERLAHGRGVGRHVDEPDVGIRLHMDGQEVSFLRHDVVFVKCNAHGECSK